MRTLPIVLAIVLPATAHAQTVKPPRFQPPSVIVPVPLPTQPTGLTQGFPFTPLPLPGMPRDLFRVGPQDPVYAPRRVPAVRAYNGIAYPYALTAAAPEARAQTATGLLRLSVTPPTAQVLVDGYYMGTAGDIDAQPAIRLDVGPHQIDIHAPEYESLTISVQIAAFQTVTYRGGLDPVRRAAPVGERLVPSPGPMYVIPNCYLGNVPPQRDRLPPACRESRVRVLPGT